MSFYIDGFVLPLARSRLNEYKSIGEAAAKIFRDHGALEYWECVGDDLNIEGTRSFLDAIDATGDETVVFSWVLYESREARDKANEKIMADPRLADLLNQPDPVFDMTKMAFGGFRSLVVAQ